MNKSMLVGGSIVCLFLICSFSFQPAIAYFEYGIMPLVINLKNN